MTKYYTSSLTNAQWQVIENKLPEQMVNTFKVLPKRWIVERTFAWLDNCRRLSKDYERKTSSSEAFIHLAQVRLIALRCGKT